MAKAITVKQLADQFNELVAKGKGDYQVFLADDEEGNGYHACWYIGTVADEVSKEEREMCEEINCDLSILTNKKKAIYLG